jgi:hypothetical protein
MMKQSGYWKPDIPFQPTLLQFFDEAFPGVDDRPHMAELFQTFDSQADGAITVDLKDVAIIKIVCDTFFIRNILPEGFKERAGRYGPQTHS